MSDTHTKENETPTVVIGAVFAALALGALGYFFANQIQTVDATSFDFAPIEIDVAKLKTERAAKYISKADLTDKKASKLLDIVRQANADQFLNRDNATKMTRSKELQISANDVLELDGLTGFHHIGTGFFDGCDEALQQAMKGETEKVRTDASFEKYREYCGDLIPHLKRLKLVTEKGSWQNPDVGPQMVRILNRYRWAFLHAKRKPVWEQMTKYEYELLENWRIKGESAFTPEERIKLAKRAAERIPDFPVDEVVASIHVQDGKLELADPHMARVCRDTKSIVWKTKCRWFNENLKSAGDDHTGHDHATEEKPVPPAQ